MKSLKLGLFFLIAFLCNINAAKASHLMGAQVTYKNIGKYKYEIYIDFYRDCRGIPLVNPTIQLKSVNSGDTMSIKSYSLISITDITNSCRKFGQICYPENKTISSNDPGIEKHSYKTTVDLTNWYNKGACQVLIGVGQCCRNGAITTGADGQDFWVYSMVDLCKWYKNTSPILNSTPLVITGCNIPVYYNIAAADLTDNDSLVYEMVDPVTNWASKTTWASGYNSQSPFKDYWPPSYDKSKGPDPLNSPPIGTYFNRQTGELVYTPTDCSETSISAIRISEYHKDSATGKYVLVGYVIRDLQVTSITFAGNNPPLIIGSENLYFPDSIESSSTYLSSDFSVNYLGVDYLYDTLKFRMRLEPSQLNNPTFNVLNLSLKNPTGIFNWKPMGLKRVRPYLLVLEVQDNACRYNYIRHKTINIFVKKKSELAWVEGYAYMDINKNCKRDSLEYLLPGAQVSANAGKNVAFIADSTGHFGGWLPADTFNFKIVGKYTSYSCTKGLKILAGKSYSLDLGALSGLQISGIVYRDTSKNCKADSLDPRVKNQIVSTIPGNFSATTDSKGYWQMNVPAAEYKILYSSKHPYTLVKCPVKPHIVNYYSGNNVKNIDFAIYDTSNISDATVSLLINSTCRRGFTTNATIVVKNNGNTTLSANSVWFKFNKKLKYVSSSSYLLKTDSTLKFSVPSLKPDEEATYKLVLNADASTCNLNDTMTTRVWMDTAGLKNDFVKTNNYGRRTIKIVAAVDPNIKQELNTNGYAWRDGNKLRYFIQFQNTGTDTAVNITVADTLNYPLLGKTLVFNGASHPYEYNLNGNILKVIFNKIYLVDTSVSKERSIGHFDFSIDIDPTLSKEFKFSNHADIYFDFAKPVKTNKQYITYTSLVKTGPTDRPLYCGTDSISVGYNSKFVFNKGNVFKLIMSDASGSFSSGTKLIDSISSTSIPGSFKFLIPSGTKDGSLYKLKVISTNPSGPVNDDALSNSFAIVSNLSKPIFGKMDALYCGKDSISLNFSSGYKSYKIYDRKTQVGSYTVSNPKIKLPTGLHYLVIKALSGSCSATSDTLKLTNDTLPIIKLSTPSHPNFKVCGNDSVTLEINGGFSSFILLGNSLAFLDSVKSNSIKKVILNTGDQRTAKVTSKLGCPGNSNTLTFTNIKRPGFTFTDSDADNEICKGDSVKFSVTGSNSIKFQLYKNKSKWLNTFRTSITSNDIDNNDLIKVMGTDTITGCSDTSAPTKFILSSSFTVGLSCSDSDLILCNNSNITFTMSGASSYKLYKNNTYWTSPGTNPITLFGINNNDEIYAEGTNKGCKSNSNKLKFKVITPAIVLKISNACIGDSVRLSFSGGVKYDLYKNANLYKTIHGQTFVSKDFANGDNLMLDGTDMYGCSDFSTSQNIAYKSKPTITISNPDTDNTSCLGENVTINFTGGTSYDLYKNNILWKTISRNTTSFTDAANQDELYAIGGSGCSNTSNKIKLIVNTATITISNPDTSNTICDSKTVTLNFSGGTKYDLYNSAGIIKANAGSPFVLSNVKDNDEVYVIGTAANGCTNNSNKIKFTVHPLPDIKINNPDADNSNCQGESVSISFAGGATYDLFKNKILWKSNTGNSVNFNDVNDKDELFAVGTSGFGCSDTSNKLKFTVWPIPSKPTISKSGSVLSSNYTFGNQWYEETIKISGAVSQNYSPVKTAIYFVDHTDVNGCLSPQSDPFSFSLTVSKLKLPGLKIYPNPASDHFIIETAETGKFHISLIDITGQLIKEEYFTGRYFEWQLKPAKGIYHLKIVNEKGESENVAVEFK